MWLQFFGGSLHHKTAPMRLAPQATRAQRPEAGPVLGIRVEHPHGSLPAAVTLTSGLKEPPNPPGLIGGFSSLSWLFLVFLEYLFFSFPVFKFCMCYFIPMVPFWTFAFAGQLHIFLNPPTPLKAEKYIWFMCIVYKAKRKKRGKKRQKNIVKEKKTT